MDEENRKELNKGNVRNRNVCWFFINEFWKNIGCLVSVHTFGIGGSRLWEKEEDIQLSGKERNIFSIRIKVDLYEFCLYEIIYCLLFYFQTILTPFFARFLVSLSLGEKGC